jgi:transposase
MTRTSYPTDLTDSQWERLEPLLPKSKSGSPNGGRPAADLREVADAVFYHLRAGGAWRMLPHDFPPWQTVYHHFRRWRLDGVWQAVHDRLREDVRVEAGAPPTPQTGRVDSQTVKTTHRGGPKGYDGGKKDRRPQAVYHGGLAGADLGLVGHPG